MTTSSSTPSAPAPADSNGPTAPMPKKIRPSWPSVVAMLGVALLGMMLVLRAWQIGPFHDPVVATDNAYVHGQITVLAPQVSGYVTEVLVQDYAPVHAGQPLVRIDARSYAAKLAQAQAQLASAQAQLANSAQAMEQDRAALQANRAGLAAVTAEAERAQAELQRVQQLAERGSVSLNERDRVRATARLATANVEKARAEIAIGEQKIKATTVNRSALEASVQMAQAQLQQARIDLDNTTVYAPSDGQVSEVGVRTGQYVTAGSQLLFVVPPHTWVVANFKETQTARIALGQRAYFTVDALEGARLNGHVVEIAPATGSEFSVLKADNATGNFTKVVQRLPVKIAIDPGQPLAARLRPGMSVVAHVDTADTPHTAQPHEQQL